MTLNESYTIAKGAATDTTYLIVGSPENKITTSTGELYVGSTL